jgi:N-methylhydantoinase A
MQLIGVDTGGTFTDVVVVTGSGQLAVAKALSTPGHLEDGVLAALRRAAPMVGADLAGLLASTDVLAHGTTVGLNALLTGTGARVGLITTAGFESTLSIAKSNKIHDLPMADRQAPDRWAKPDVLVDPRDIAGVAGRVDASGAVLADLDEDQVRAAIAGLLRRGARSLAVCLLWSPANPAHEDRVRELVAELAPGVPVTTSSRLASRIGEYERMTTAVIDAYIAPLVSTYLERLDKQLRELGFGGTLLVVRMGGGVQPAQAARQQPVHTLRSGPAGGVAAARQLGAQAGFTSVIAADVGGTSFDVGLIIDGEPQYARRPTISRLPLAVRAVDIESIGTGGGSIAWIDTALGSLRVGPQTAAASPGPACYGLGGTRPTLTDAAVVLGYIDRLGGSLRLDAGAAGDAIRREIAEPLGLSVTAAADGIVQVACEQMRDLVRRATVQRGHDPADFALLAYGGAGPQYAAWFAAGLGVRGVIIPALAAGLSAYGALCGDLRVRAERDLRPQPLTEALSQVAAALAELEPEVRRQLHGAGPDAQICVTRTAGLRFHRQLHRIEVEVPADATAADLIARFRDRYEQVIGPGTAPEETPVEVLSVAVDAWLPTTVPATAARGPASGQPARYKTAVFDGRDVRCCVYRWADLGAGQRVAGPAFIEAETTTAIVRPGQAAVVGQTGELHLELGS